VSWTANGETITGRTAGIDPEGALLIRTGGEVRRIISGEIIWD